MDNELKELFEQLKEYIESEVIPELEEHVDRALSVKADPARALTIKEAAAFLGVPTSSVYKMTSRKELPYYLPGGGGRAYLLREDLAAWQRKNRVQAVPPSDEEAHNNVSRTNRK